MKLETTNIDKSLLKEKNKIYHNIDKIREDFPILKQKVRGKTLVYLDNAATTQKPKIVIDAISNYYLTLNSNIHRGVHFLSEKATFEYEKARTKVKEFINALSASEIVFTRGATESINLAAFSYGLTYLKDGDEIIISTLEHHANIVPWQEVCRRTGAKLKVIPISNNGEILLEKYYELLNNKVKIVAVTQVSNALGVKTPIDEIIKKAKEIGAITLVDGSQAIPHLKIDVQSLGCDFYVFSGHKVYGPTGIGVLYGKADLLEKMPPYQTGGDMIRSVTFEKTIYNDIPMKFEAGTPNIEGAIALQKAIEYVENLNIEEISEYEDALLRYCEEKLSDIPDLIIYGRTPCKAAVVSFDIKDIHPHDIGTILDSEGVAIRAGHHCTQPLMQRLGVSATARASFSFYNTFEEIDILYQALLKTIKLMK
jgi:cysteine desulfurase/selenocysteine lyase